MKKRIISLFLVLALVLMLTPAVGAASIDDMTDVPEEFWARDYITWVLEQGLFNGVSDTEFAPDSSMTRGMFVTVLGRFEGIDPEEYRDWYLPYLYTDVNSKSYYAPYVNWATRLGITSGVGNNKFNPDAPITREQMATFMVRYAEIYGYAIAGSGSEIPEAFEDAASVGNFAKEAVETMRLTGIMNGRRTATGYIFDPKALATRAECAAVFHRLYGALSVDPDVEIEEPYEVNIYDEELNLCPGDKYELSASVYSYYATNKTLTWVSSDPSVVTVDSRTGAFTVVGKGTAEIWVYTSNGCSDSCVINSSDYVGYADESYYWKCMHVFGEYVSNPRKPYGDGAEKQVYLDNMVTVKVQVWDFKDPDDFTSEKVTRTRTFQVHKNLALTAKLIFEEIYACEEQYPINSIVTYWSTTGNSEHCPGLAIDVNPEENPYVDKNGNVTTGEAFDPENNPYSMPIDGEIQQIFEKYGFTRGIYWNSGAKDYMHYSFFGT